MKLRCRSCDTRFEVSAGDKARCPNCLRTLGLEPDLPAGPEPAAGRSVPSDRGRWLGVGIACGVLALAGVLAALLLGGRCPARDSGAPSAVAGDELSPAEAARRKGEALRLAAEGRELLNSGKLREANVKADAAFRLAPVEAEVRQLRGEIYLASGAFAEAAGELVAALSAKETPERHVLAGETLAALGEVPRAEQHLKRARVLDPAGTRPAVALALLYQATNRSEELAALRKELATADGGATPLLQAVDEGLQRMEEARARQLEELRRRLAEARQGPDAGAGSGQPEPGRGSADPAAAGGSAAPTPPAVAPAPHPSAPAPGASDALPPPPAEQPQPAGGAGASRPAP